METINTAAVAPLAAPAAAAAVSLAARASTLLIAPVAAAVAAAPLAAGMVIGAAAVGVGYLATRHAIIPAAHAATKRFTAWRASRLVANNNDAPESFATQAEQAPQPHQLRTA